MDKKVRIAVFVSGGGTNLQALMDAQDKGILKSGEIVLVLASNPNAYALERAKTKSIATAVAWKKELGSQEAFEAAVEKELAAHKIDLIVLAGFMNILSANFTAKAVFPVAVGPVTTIVSGKKLIFYFTFLFYELYYSFKDLQA